MKSKAELTAEAVALGAELGVAVDTDGLNHKALTALVAELEAKKAARASEPPTKPPDPTADTQPPAPPPNDSTDPAERPTSPEVKRPPKGKAPPPVDGAPTDRIGGAQPIKRVLSYPMQVADGRLVVCARGKLGAGARVKASDFEADVLKQLIADGTVLVRE